jgi:hypothetical protein
VDVRVIYVGPADACWSSTERRMICVSSIVRYAASWAAATTFHIHAVLEEGPDAARPAHR